VSSLNFLRKVMVYPIADISDRKNKGYYKRPTYQFSGLGSIPNAFSDEILIWREIF
jgi:hypothetical protein